MWTAQNSVFEMSMKWRQDHFHEGRYWPPRKWSLGSLFSLLCSSTAANSTSLACVGFAPMPVIQGLCWITHPMEELQHRHHKRAKRGKDPEEKGVQKGEEITVLIYTTCTTWLSYKLQGVITLNVLTYVCLKSELLHYNLGWVFMHLIFSLGKKKICFTVQSKKHHDRQSNKYHPHIYLYD